MTDHTANTQ